MSLDESDDAARIDQEFRIIELQDMAEELTGGSFKAWISPECPPEIEAQFWESVVAFESALRITHFDQLIRDGIEMPPPEALDDDRLGETLAAVIRQLAARRVYLHHTDHLSDRELYACLYGELLQDDIPVTPPGFAMNHHLDLIGSGSDEDIYLWMKYYADEATRQDWLAEWPQFPMPAHEDPPYHRDHSLPQADYRMPSPHVGEWN